MNQIKTIAIALTIVFFGATIHAQTKKVILSESKISWVGKKVTGQHEGTVNLKEGSLTFNGKTLSGGIFTIDMNSIVANDLKPGEGKEKLEGHLKSADFFSTDKYPTATLLFKTITDNKSGKYTITADLTIKNIKGSVTFDLIIKGNTATAKLKIDRTKYDIKFKSASFFENLGDKTIYDDFDLEVTLQF